MNTYHIADVDSGAVQVGDKIVQGGQTYTVVGRTFRVDPYGFDKPAGFYLTWDGDPQAAAAFRSCVNGRGFAGQIRWESAYADGFDGDRYA